jgi:hypothetical protein
VSTWEEEKFDPEKLRGLSPEERGAHAQRKARDSVKHIKKPVHHPATVKGLSSPGFNDNLDFFPCWKCKALLPRYETKCGACESPVKLIR